MVFVNRAFSLGGSDFFSQRFWALPVWACLLLGGAVSGSGSPRKPLPCPSRKAEQYLLNQQYAAAAAEIEKHWAACVPSSLLYQRLGFAYYYAGQPEKALQTLQTAKEWRTAELQVQLAEGNHREGNHQGEKAEAQAALARAPQSTEALSVLGRACEETGDRPCAENAYQRSIALRPQESRAYEDIGSLYLKRGCYQKAEWYFRKAAALHSNRPDLFRQLGLMYQCLGQTEKAQSAFARASRLAASKGP